MKRADREYSVAVVTGAGRGIGKATAFAMTHAGWRVALVSRTRKELEAVRDEIDGKGGEASCHVGDVSDLGSVREMWAEVCERWGDPDCLVNNAAVVEPVGPAVEVDPSSWARSVEINLIGAFFCARTAVRTMVDRRRGSLLNLVSGMGEKIFPFFSAYSVSKAGLIHLTRVLAEEARPYGVTVNALDPGLVHTDMQAALRDLPAEAVGEEMWSRFRLFHEKDMLKPPELVGRWIAAFLADYSEEVTGEVGSLSDYQERHGIPVVRP
jgi:NAD(P)-dependent dehydrogenase (short-subunit alcohol dehydrogenase family)